MSGRDVRSPSAEMTAIEVVKEVTAAWGRRDLDALMTFVAEDCTYYASVGPEPGETFAGREAVREGFAKLLAHDSDSVSEPGEMWSTGETVVSTWTFRKTASDGRPIAIRGCDIFVVRDGLVVRKDSFRKTYA